MVSRSSNARLNHSLLLVTQSKKLVEVHAFRWIFKIFVHSIMHTYTSISANIGGYWFISKDILSISPHTPDSIRACGCSR